jgi:tetratricopeptide (TPR) repeat protein
LVIAYFNYVKEPNEQEAYDTIFMAEQYFAKDSFNLALNGDRDYPGFLDIIDEYGSTKSGNLAHYYAGICYLRLANDNEATRDEYLNNAIDELSSFSSDDINIKPMAIGGIGDAYMELGDMDKAVSYYIKAANHNDNKFTTPLFLKKAGMTYSILGDHQKALDAFNTIKTKYYQSTEGRDIKKYIGREEAYLNK